MRLVANQAAIAKKQNADKQAYEAEHPELVAATKKLDDIIAKMKGDIESAKRLLVTREGTSPAMPKPKAKVKSTDPSK